MEINQNYRCSVCGGDLSFDPASQKLKCIYCGAVFTMEDMEKEGKSTLHHDTYEKGQQASDLGYTESTDDTGVNPEDLLVYKCKYCSAEIITDKTTAATTCIYCGNPIVIEEQLVNSFTPKWVLPFKIQKKEVKEKYLAFIKKRFTPNSFMSEDHIEKIKGVYIPFWLYDANVKGQIQYSGEITRTFRSGDYSVTKHDVFQIRRSGDQFFTRIPADASAKTDNDLMDSLEPFDYKEMVPFEMPYLAGFFAERYDEDATKCKERIIPRVRNQFKASMQDTVSKYSSCRIEQESIQENVTGTEYVLLPVYLLNTNYNGKLYQFAMNGQTGKVVGNIPIDKNKVMIFWLKLSGVFALAFGLIHMFM